MPNSGRPMAPPPRAAAPCSHEHPRGRRRQHRRVRRWQAHGDRPDRRRRADGQHRLRQAGHGHDVGPGQGRAPASKTTPTRRSTSAADACIAPRRATAASSTQRSSRRASRAPAAKACDAPISPNAEADARGAQRGCAWGGAPAAPGGQGDQNGQDAPSKPEPRRRRSPCSATSDSTASLRASVAHAAPLAAPRIPPASRRTSCWTPATPTAPTNFVFAPDGRIFVAQQNGVVRVFKNGALLPTPLIDLQDRVNDYWDHGLLGMALDPNFAQNGYHLPAVHVREQRRPTTTARRPAAWRATR